MAKGYQLIQAQTLTSSASSVTFSNIPQNYTDLIVKISARSALAGTGTSRAIQLQINGDTTYANYRQRYIRTDDTGSAQSGAFLSSTGLKYYLYGLPNANVTANSFGAAELTFINYAGSSYKTFSVEAFAEGFHNPFTGTAGNSVTAALWVNTSPITTLVFNPDDSSFAAGSTFYLYGIGGTRATGGTITSDANYTYHTFTSTNTFTPLEKIKNAEILLVAGGGGGGGGTFTNANSGGGGGAGGVIAYTGQTFYAGTSYTSLIGAGGAGGSTSVGVGSRGASSTFGALSAVGGGGGGAEVSGGEGGTTGGSGGGADSKSTQAGSAGTAGQGFAGGSTAGSNGAAAGGGGAGGAGINATSGSYDGGANGGVGTTAYHNWHYATLTGVLFNGNYYIGGGGGGGSYRSTGGPGGIGGGGTGGQSTNDNDTAGTANTGGGGGGSANQGAGRAGSAGGSGLIIIRYPNV